MFKCVFRKNFSKTVSLYQKYFFSKAPMTVSFTGAAGQIGYATLFRIASGEMLGKD